MPHPLLASFTSNAPAFGTWLTNGSGGFFHARAMAQGSPDLAFIVIDCEHGLVNLNPGVAELVAAIHGVDGCRVGSGGAGSGATEENNRTSRAPSAIVRVAATGWTGGVNWQIKYALDAGARGVLVPMVSTPTQARSIVSDARYPPLGRRGFGGAYTQGNYWGKDMGKDKYIKHANDNVLVLIQIETVEGLKNVKEIAEVEGIDGLFVGPSDLSIALGYPPIDPPQDQVQKATQEILDAAHGAGKKW
ncbi:hypothetical protein D9758_016654 [Tetrapyrgos nigripes]|uniref:HpcH/HpaI aldolase/citrate lyase domain-containing protein n=1 Tax=Tetrapyrgos nigripes TaxID=182062 RepID=A0A8H5CGF8_9AGAR|nr:hypothetical protein D9758_016654 [Tetrapyrgos nigripes]